MRSILNLMSARTSSRCANLDPSLAIRSTCIPMASKAWATDPRKPFEAVPMFALYSETHDLYRSHNTVWVFSLHEYMSWSNICPCWHAMFDHLDDGNVLTQAREKRSLHDYRRKVPVVATTDSRFFGPGTGNYEHGDIVTVTPQQEKIDPRRRKKCNLKSFFCERTGKFPVGVTAWNGKKPLSIFQKQTNPVSSNFLSLHLHLHLLVFWASSIACRECTRKVRNTRLQFIDSFCWWVKTAFFKASRCEGGGKENLQPFEQWMNSSFCNYSDASCIKNFRFTLFVCPITFQFLASSQMTEGNCNRRDEDTQR